MCGKWIAGVAVTVQLVCLAPIFAADDWVRVVPKETDEILANPGMGWETFHRTSKQDKTLPLWIPSTIHYIRWGWGEVETQPGKIDEALLDKVLRETHESGQKLAFRVMCCSTNLGRPYHPKWLKEVGGKELQTDYEGRGPLLIPDLDDAVVLERHLDLIKRLGARYDGHSDIDHVDLGSVGWWGEWHMSGSSRARMPKAENQKKIVDAYLAAFTKTPLVMLLNAPMLRYATDHGTGWRADCLGCMDFHMPKGYPQWFTKAQASDVWTTSPVAWETGGVIRTWTQQGWSLRFIFNYALALHGSYINNKSASLPTGPDVRPEIERFLRRLGYRLVLKELRHPPQVKAGEKLELAMKWQNTGSAPCYRPYRLAYRLTNRSGAARVFASKITVSRWLPGSIELFTKEFFKQPADLPPGEVANVQDAIVLPSDLVPGEYIVSIAVVGEKDEKPVVRLGIQGRGDGAWYPVSKLSATR